MSMRGHAMGGGRGGGWAGMRSIRQDRSVLGHRVKKGTARRMLTFAVPYRKILAIFIPVVILGAVIGAVNPLILQSLIDNGILKHDESLVVWLAVLVAILAVADAGLSLVERRISAYLGESLIYDMRSKVFRHIQRMPLAFFTRTQTGALVSRLNNDVIGAQQAFTDLLSNVIGNLVTVIIVVGVMFFLSWPITLAALILLPIFLIPARFVGQRIGSLTKEGYDLNSEMNMVMQERFQVGGAMLVKLNGRPAAEAEAFDAKAGRVRDIGIAQATYARFFFVALTLTASLATAIVYGVGGVAAIHGALQVGHGGRARRLPDPALRAADAALEPEPRRHDGPRLVRAALRGARHRPHDPGGPRRRGHPAGPRLHRVRPRQLHLSGRRRGLARLARVGRGPRDRPAQRGPPRRVLHRGARTDGRAGRAFGGGQDDDLEPGPAPVRRDLGLGAPERDRRAARHHGVGARRRRSGDPGPPPLPRHAAGQPALRPARGDRGGGPRRARAGADRAPRRRSPRRPRHRHRRAGLPALGWGETARGPGAASC